ncbi:MAG: hypothetical protein AAGF01_16445 [Cyanobacteria bacterium P01_G01_bin.38]
MSQQRPKRKRGVILTNAGLQKLQTAKRKVEIWENDGDRYTFEELSQRTGLAPITVAKVLNRDTGVDKQSLILCLSAFGLILADDDYTKPTHPSRPSQTIASSQSTVPQGWSLAGSRPYSYAVSLDSINTYYGSNSVLIQSKSPQADGFGTLMQIYKADRYRGQRLKLSSYLKTEAVKTWAGLWMRVEGFENQILSFDNMQNRSITGTTPWTEHAVVLDVPDTSKRIAFGVLLAGSGQVWCTRFQFDTVGPDIPTTGLETVSQLPDQPTNLDFEIGSVDSRSQHH